MFKHKPDINEIAAAMERHLVEGAINKQAQVEERLFKAADYLNSAAEIFDESGLVAQAELITAVLESLAAKKSKKKLKSKPKKVEPKKNPFKKAPSSEKMVSNLKEKGWVFDESKAADKQCADDNCAMCGGPSRDKMMARDKADKDTDLDDAELYSMLDDFKARTDADFEDEDEDLRNPDTFTEEALHPDFKQPPFKLHDPEYSEDFGEPEDPLYSHHARKQNRNYDPLSHRYDPNINYFDDLD